MDQELYNDSEFQQQLPNYARPYITQCFQDIAHNLPIILELLANQINANRPDTDRISNTPKQKLKGVVSCFITLSHILKNQDLSEYLVNIINEIAKSSNLDIYEIEPKPLLEAVQKNPKKISAVLHKIQETLPQEPENFFGIEADYLKNEEHLCYDNASCALSMFLYFAILKIKVKEEQLNKSESSFDQYSRELNKNLQEVIFWHGLVHSFTRSKEYVGPAIEKIVHGQKSKEKSQSNRNTKYERFIEWVMKYPHPEDFANGKVAVRKFLAEMKTKTRDYDSVTERAMETYLTKLKSYCSRNDITNPIYNQQKKNHLK